MWHSDLPRESSRTLAWCCGDVWARERERWQLNDRFSRSLAWCMQKFAANKTSILVHVISRTYTIVRVQQIPIYKNGSTNFLEWKYLYCWTLNKPMASSSIWPLELFCIANLFNNLSANTKNIDITRLASIFVCVRHSLFHPPDSVYSPW